LDYAVRLHYVTSYLINPSIAANVRQCPERTLDISPAISSYGRKAALEAISTIISEIKAGASAVASDYKLWIYLSLRLLRNDETDETVRKVIGELLKLDKIDEVWKESMSDPELSSFLEKVGDVVKQPQQR
jgi:hypothetical protein